MKMMKWIGSSILLSGIVMIITGVRGWWLFGVVAAGTVCRAVAACAEKEEDKC